MRDCRRPERWCPSRTHCHCQVPSAANVCRMARCGRGRGSGMSPAKMDERWQEDALQMGHGRRGEGLICMRKQERKIVGTGRGRRGVCYRRRKGHGLQANAVGGGGRWRNVSASDVPRPPTRALLPAAIDSSSSPHRLLPKFSSRGRTRGSAPGGLCFPSPALFSSRRDAPSCNHLPTHPATARDSLVCAALPVQFYNLARRPAPLSPASLSPSLSSASPLSLRPLCCLEPVGSSAV
ncbi:hypothetical protein L226DRAFT_324722 [Lentinus tigrinus ALCF2SS1-7]|uniref:Uncharacterized protein n=1 Tax=Lentinus tigrinus ALCF2SS1-6 TaxID=1328759 RepID=A0A5C2SHV5_9APHY|nr:hypothetical protein L227DRAFT_434012 [Lentinus tigrinus ALCF2SS1-6]RPD77527.1 hypothetical protein L226DRAFT_324722 [Lentinus tigrinus ALCF2SS1-7]